MDLTACSVCRFVLLYGQEEPETKKNEGRDEHKSGRKGKEARNETAGRQHPECHHYTEKSYLLKE